MNKIDAMLNSTKRPCTHAPCECEKPAGAPCLLEETFWRFRPAALHCPDAGRTLRRWIHAFRCRWYHQEHPEWIPPGLNVKSEIPSPCMAWLPPGYRGPAVPPQYRPLKHGGFLGGDTVFIIQGSRGY